MKRFKFQTKVLLMFVMIAGGSAHAQQSVLLFVLNNDPAGNTVTVIRHNADGTLETLSSNPTGGLGIGSPLETQDSLVANDGGTLLFAVNAGSNNISSFRVLGPNLTLAGTFPSGGTRPASVAVRNGIVYVLNKGDTGNIAGFIVGADGMLLPISGSARRLSSSKAGGSQVQFFPDGSRLVVTERDSNKISLYSLDSAGLPLDGPLAIRSHGKGPFGFSFDPRGFMLVSEAFAGRKGNSAASSYVFQNGRLKAISGSISTHQAAACWLVVTRDSHFAFTSNTGSSSVSAFSVGERGNLKLLTKSGVTASTGAHSAPTELALSPDDHVLYTLLAAENILAAFAINNDGTLTVAGTVNIPAFATGIVVK